MAEFKASPQRVDPYRNFKFKVKWDGEYVAGVSKVSGLEKTTEAVRHRSGGDPSTTRKSIGQEVSLADLRKDWSSSRQTRLDRPRCASPTSMCGSASAPSTWPTKPCCRSPFSAAIAGEPLEGPAVEL